MIKAELHPLSEHDEVDFVQHFRWNCICTWCRLVLCLLRALGRTRFLFDSLHRFWPTDVCLLSIFEPKMKTNSNELGIQRQDWTSKCVCVCCIATFMCSRLTHRQLPLPHFLCDLAPTQLAQLVYCWSLNWVPHRLDGRTWHKFPKIQHDDGHTTQNWRMIKQQNLILFEKLVTTCCAGLQRQHMILCRIPAATYDFVSDPGRNIWFCVGSQPQHLILCRIPTRSDTFRVGSSNHFVWDAAPVQHKLEKTCLHCKKNIFGFSWHCPLKRPCRTQFFLISATSHIPKPP